MKIKNVSVIVPTVNSEKYIGALIETLIINFSEIIIGIDKKTKDKTLEIVKKYPVKYIIITNESGHVENGMIKKLSDACTNNWIIRLDDDESISNQLIEFINEKIQKINVSCVGFHRKWCRINQSQLEWMALPDYSYDWQWRLFRKDQVNFVNDIHTPGYTFETSMCAPIEACIFHLDWIYHSHQERVDKIKRYESIRTGSGISVKHYYLYEEINNFQSYFVRVWESSIPSILKEKLIISDCINEENNQFYNAQKHIFTYYNEKSCKEKLLEKIKSLFTRSNKYSRTTTNVNLTSLDQHNKWKTNNE